MRISNTRISTKDKFYDNVSLLLKMDGANGSTTFTDSSPTPKTVTPSGNAQISTAQSKFGGSSALFDGSSYLTLPTIDALNYNSPFTIEGWVYPTNLSGNRGIFSQRTGGTYAPLCVMANSNTLRILVANASVTTWNSIDTSGNVFTLNTWAHVAVCGTGSQLLFFVNGVLVITASQPAWTTLYPLYIGADGDGNWFGHIDEVRFTKGVARYTSNFTTPDSVTPYRLSSTQNIDPFYDNVSLLLKMNGANGSTTFIDSSPNTKTITVNGGAQIRTDQWKFNGSSSYFDGNGDYLAFTNSTLITSSDLTIEFWYWIGVAHDGTFYSNFTTNTSGHNLVYNYTNGAIQWYYNGNTSIVSSGGVLLTSQWAHVALVKSGSTYTIFHNGVQVAQALNTGVTSFGTVGTEVRIGNAIWTTRDYNGYIDDFRITNGVARYTSNFTPPTAPFADAQIVDSLLLHFDGSNGSTNFVDSAYLNNSITSNGSAALSTAQSRFGGSSLLIDSTSKYLSIPDNNIFNVGGSDFTIEMWLYGTTWTSVAVLSKRASTAVDSPIIVFFSGSTICARFTNSSNTTYTITGSVLSTSVWNHVAYTRSGNNIYLFVNGTQVGGTLAVTGSALVNTSPITIGNEASYVVTPGTPTYYIDELRFTKGLARYIANFTPPPAPFDDRNLPYDLYSKYTSLLLHFDGSDNSTNFVDSSLNPKTITANGDVKIRVPIKKYGSGSAYFDGNGDYLSTPYAADYDFGSGDFTVEAWVYIAGNSSPDLVDGVRGASIINSFGSTTVVGWNFIIVGNTTTTGIGIGFDYWNPTTTSVGTLNRANVTVNQGQWNHIAVTRSFGTLIIFLNGFAVSYTSSNIGAGYSQANASANGIKIGGSINTSYPAVLNGYIDDLRITKGIARYGAGDPFYSNVLMLLHMDGANGSTTFTDSSPYRWNITRIGTGGISNTQSKFGGVSGYFPGDSSYLGFPADNVWNLGTSNFTVEYWVYPIAGGGANYKRHFNSEVSSTQTLVVREDQGLLRAYIRTGSTTVSQINGSTNVTYNVWQHVAFVRSGNTFTLYLNGQSIGTMNNSGAIDISSVGPVIGSVSPESFAGYFDEIRFTKGIARYTANFTPPSQAFFDNSANFTPPTKALLDPYDIYYSNVSLLLPMNGTNGGTNFVDYSVNYNAITINGSAKISTAQSKFGSSSALFNGTSDYLTLTSATHLDISTGDFTIEAWVRLNAMPTTDTLSAWQNWMVIYERGNASASDGWQFQIGQTLLMFSDSYGTAVCSGTHGMVINTWYHLSVTRSGNTFRVFVNGVQVGTSTSSITLNSGSTYWIGTETGQGAYLNGYIDDLRVTKGVARYTANFTPPTQEFTNLLPISSDPNYYNNSLLLHFDGTNGSTTFTDSSCRTKTITANGNVQISTTQSRFGGSSAYFDGNGDYLSTPNNTEYHFANGDFTIESWVYLTGYATNNGGFFKSTIAAYDILNSRSWAFNIVGTASSFTQFEFTGFSSNTTLSTVVANYTFSLNTWYHIACVRSGNTIYLFANGILQNSGSFSLNMQNSTSALKIGASEWDPTFKYYLNGYIDELRITKSVARYTDNFIPSTESFYPPSDLYYPNVSLLLPMNGTNGSTTFTDRSPTPKTVTANGSAALSTAQSKFGGSSALFDGTGDWLTSPNNSDFDLGSGTFTVEAWVYITGSFAFNLDSLRVGTVVAYGSNLVAGQGWELNIDQTNNRIVFATAGSGFLFNCSSTLALNTWYHIAVVRNGTTNLIFVNGVSQNLLTNSYTGVSSSTGTLRIGSNRLYVNYNQDYLGYIDDLRITKGVARYTANFTPPTRPSPIG